MKLVMVFLLKGREAGADALILGVTLVFCYFILLMFIIHSTYGRQLSHARPEPASRLRRGDGGAQSHARRPQPVDHPACGQQCAASAARSAWRRAGAARWRRRGADAAGAGAVAH